jgi:lipopolysaccharide biosynthesis regulator YciM
MQEWLLLPGFVIAIAIGWLLGRYSAFLRARQNHIKTLPEAYYRGVGYLLNEQPEQAMSMFMEALDKDSESIDTHLALGKLFRSRGELEKATRLHQNLLARPNLEMEQRLQIQFELATDYLAGGLLDRAERLLKELARERGETPAKSLYLLLDIYQQEKDWIQAIGVAEQLSGLGAKGMPPIIAHYYCELAQQRLGSGPAEMAGDAIRQALLHDPACVRAYLLLADLQIQAEHYREAIKTLKQVKKHSPDYLSESMPVLEACYEALGNEKGFNKYLLECLNDGTLIPSGFNASKNLRKSSASPKGLTERFFEEANRAPSLKGLHSLIDMQMYEASGEDVRYLQELREFVEQLIAEKAAYRCAHCGYQGKHLMWLCPGCHQWGTIRPDCYSD